MPAAISLRTIVVPTDFSDTADVALTYARQLAEAFGSRLHLLHVIEEPHLGAGAEAFYGFSMAEVMQKWEAEARARLETLVPEGRRPAGGVAVRATVGHAFVEIVRHARDVGADLIVLGTHGRGAVKHMLLGSVAEKVIRKAPCPVLVVRHPEHRFERP